MRRWVLGGLAGALLVALAAAGRGNDDGRRRSVTPTEAASSVVGKWILHDPLQGDRNVDIRLDGTWHSEAGAGLEAGTWRTEGDRFIVTEQQAYDVEVDGDRLSLDGDGDVCCLDLYTFVRQGVGTGLAGTWVEEDLGDSLVFSTDGTYVAQVEGESGTWHLDKTHLVLTTPTTFRMQTGPDRVVLSMHCEDFTDKPEEVSVCHQAYGDAGIELVLTRT